MFEASVLSLIELLIGGPDPVDALIKPFEQRSGTSRFNLGSDPVKVRAEYATRLRELADNPRLLHQKTMNACGMAAFLYLWMKNSRSKAVAYAIDLFEQGRATIGSLEIAPTRELLDQDYAKLKRVGGVAMPDMVDWVMMSALRNATQVGPLRFLGTLKEGVTALVLPHEFADWMRATGLYSVVTNNANIAIQQHLPIWRTLSPGDSDVAVLMHTRMLMDIGIRGLCRQAAQEKGDALLEMVTPNHYVILEEKITPVDNTKLQFRFWCWGDSLGGDEDPTLSDRDPKKSCFPFKINQTIFEDNFFGAVVGVR